MFGCIAYYHVKDNKLDNRAKKAIFFGYARGVKGYRLWSLEDSKFIISRDVTFDENSIDALSKAGVPKNGEVATSKSQVVEIEEYEDQPNSSHDQEESHGDTYSSISTT